MIGLVLDANILVARFWGIEFERLLEAFRGDVVFHCSARSAVNDARRNIPIFAKHDSTNRCRCQFLA